MTTFWSWTPWIITVAVLAWSWWRRRVAVHPPEVPAVALHASTASTVSLLPTSEQFIDLLDVGVLFLHPNGVIITYNETAAQLLDLHPHNRGHSIMSVVRDHQLDDFVAETMLRGERDEMLLPRRNPARTLKVSAQRLTTSQATTVMVVIIRDVTQISQLERARRDMVASVSHELRTPLAALKLLSETIATNPPADVAQRMALRISDEVDTLNHLVNDLHDLSQIEAGRIALQLAPHPPLTHVMRVIERMTPAAAEHHIHLHHDVSDTLPLVLSDANRIDQVLLNLVHNAVKFTPDYGHISIHAEMVSLPQHQPASHQIPANHPHGDWMLFSITDSGAGIPAEHQQRIFERFYKVDQARTRGSGSGLGLAIARHLIEGHSGRIWVNSTVGLGTTFFFTLPTAHESSTQQ
jgi:two-component system phosphate regulon sensor histidine kinase PhoR